MEFLKSILGEELYAQLETKLNAYNGNEDNKDKQIKLADLGSGEYVGKGKYDALQALLDGKTTELEKANGLIADLKKGAKDDEDLQGKITAYEGQVQQLQEQLQEAKIKSAVKVALLSEKALDVDYLTFRLERKLKEDGKTIELDDAGNIKDVKNLMSELKTSFPNQFESSAQRKIRENQLPDSSDPDNDAPNSLASALKMAYEPN